MLRTSFGVRLLVLFLFCVCPWCQRHAIFAFAAPSFSNLTSTPSSKIPGHRHGVVNTTVAGKKDEAMPAATASFFDEAPPPHLWSSKSKTSWPSMMNGFSPSTLPKYQKGAGGAASHEDIPKDNRNTSVTSTSFSTPRVASNRSDAIGPSSAPPHKNNLRRPPGKSGGDAFLKARKQLCSLHRTAPSSLHGRVECSGLVVVVVMGSALLVSLCSLAVAALLLLRRARRVQREEIGGGGSSASADPEDDDRPAMRPGLVLRAAGPRRYSYSTLAATTCNFAECKRIGRGGFGSVYRGYLEDQDRHVAVKMFSAAGSLPEQGSSREFEAEVEVMSQLRHRNVVQLVGWSDGHKGFLLVYELVSGGSLHKHLHHSDRLLNWPERYKIALDLGAAILYLHTELDRCVVHGDIKPSNVMLDLSGNAKLGDFGLARLVDHGAEPRTTQVVAGTLGYVDPEFVGDRMRGTESDVYSFGIVLLEIACGSRPTMPSGQPGEEEASTLLNRVRLMYDRNAILDAADRRLGGAFDERQMERVLVAGLWCADRDRSRRPSIARAMDFLRSANTEMLLPALPAVALNCRCEETRVLKERAYGDLSTEDVDDRSTISSDISTAYLSL